MGSLRGRVRRPPFYFISRKREEEERELRKKQMENINEEVDLVLIELEKVKKELEQEKGKGPKTDSVQGSLKINLQEALAKSLKDKFSKNVEDYTVN